MTANESSIVYDGSLEGFYCVVFRLFKNKHEPVHILREQEGEQLTLDAPARVATCLQTALRVRKGVVKYSSEQNTRLLETAFLSELRDVELVLWRYLKKMFERPPQVFFRNLLDKEVSDVVNIARQVRREVHRFHGLVRFQKTKDGMYAAAIDPDHRIVYLLAPHFLARFKDAPWVIYDTRRNEGVWFDGRLLQEVEMKGRPFDTSTGLIAKNARAVDDEGMRRLWKLYYDALHIRERTNHRQMRSFMPRRYWKYLPEKQGGNIF